MICSEGFYKVVLGGKYVTHDPTSGKRERSLDLFLIQKVIWYLKKINLSRLPYYGFSQCFLLDFWIILTQDHAPSSI